MNCQICGSERFEDRVLDLCFLERPHPAVIRGVPAKVCAQCGDRVFRFDAAERIEAIDLNGHPDEWGEPLRIFNYERRADADGVPAAPFLEDAPVEWLDLLQPAEPARVISTADSGDRIRELATA